MIGKPIFFDPTGKRGRVLRGLAWAMGTLSAIVFVMFAVTLIVVHRPGNDGFDVLKWLEDRGVRPVVVVLSESGTDTDIEQALALGVDKYLQKPDGLPRLIDFIREFCSR